MASPSHSSHTPAALVERAKTLGADLADEVRRTNRYTKIRAAVIGSWVLLSIATLWGACPSSGPTNSLGAEVQLFPDPLGGTQFQVRNESSSLWTEIVLTLDDSWTYDYKTLRPHEQVFVPLSQFRRGDETAPRDYRARVLRIRCREGHFTMEIEGGR